MGYQPKNERRTCICGELRINIRDNVWRARLERDNPVHHAYYFRCQRCHSFSSVNLYFPVEAYTETPIAAFFVGEQKVRLNESRVQWIRQRTALPENAVFFDLGAGEGCFVDHFTKSFPQGQAVAVEHDERMREKFYGPFERVNFVVAFLEDFLRESGEFPAPDLVALTDVLEHVISPETVLEMVSERLNPGGYAYLTIPNSRSYGDYPHRLKEVEVDWSAANTARQHLWMMEPRAFVDLVARYFDVVEMSRSFETNIRQDSDYITVLATTK